MVIDLPFEGRKVAGGRKYRSVRVPKAGRRREETVTELIIKKKKKKNVNSMRKNKIFAEKLPWFLN